MGTVLDLVRDWTAAEQDNDAERLDGYLSDGFVGVGPLGFVLDRDQWLGRFRGGLANRAFAVADAQVHDHGDAAILVGVLDQQTTWQGRDNSGRFRITLGAVRRGDGWRLASVHIGPLQVPPGG
jgi:ketosteroid isomerase-like protein